MKKLMLSALMLLPLSSYAVSINVSATCGALNPTVCDQLEQGVRDLVNEDLPDVSIGDYGTGIANANSFASKGLGSDYSDHFDFFMVRGGGGLAVQGDIDDAESADGLGFGAAATVGLNLDLLPIDKIGPVDFSKMDLFVSFMSYNVDQSFDDTDAEGDISSFGVMARYQIVDEKDIVPGSILKWGGVHFHTGFQRSSIEANVTQKFQNETVDIGGGQTATVTNTNAKFSFETATTTIPLEVSTYLRAGYVFTFFGGAGFDLVTGSTDVDLNASGTARGNGSVSDFDATISANESDSGDADPTNLRAFGGFQFNIPFVRLGVQINKGLGNDLFGINFGAKVLW